MVLSKSFRTASAVTTILAACGLKHAAVAADLPAETAGQRIANGFESKDRWWMEYENKRLAPMAERLSRISKDGSGIILRPFHEADGD